MILCLDIGNSSIFGGVFNETNELLFSFRRPTYSNITPDQIGKLLKTVLQNNQVNPEKIKSIALCSVVPWIDYSLKVACKKHFKINPFVLTATTNIPIGIKTITPAENGADIIAGAIAATNFYPDQDILVIDLGTVTTIAAIRKNRDYLGVTFIPGVQTAMNSLKANTSSLPPVEIAKPEIALGRSTVQSIQSGLFWGQLGAIKEIVSRITDENFPKKKPIIIATGGLAPLFKEEKFFTHLEPELVLHGIKIAYEYDSNKENS